MRCFIAAAAEAAALCFSGGSSAATCGVGTCPITDGVVSETTPINIRSADVALGVPLPGAFILLLSGLAGLVFSLRPGRAKA